MRNPPTGLRWVLTLATAMLANAGDLTAAFDFK
jgi:hypothetical protein